MIVRFLFLVSFCLSVQTGWSLTPVRKMEIGKGSQIIIYGTSNLMEFSCLHSTLHGEGVLSETHFRSLQISLKIDGLDCGHKRINRDMQKALKSQSFPFVQYRMLETCELIPDEGSKDKWLACTYGELEIAGVKRQVNIEFTVGKDEAGMFQVTGEKRLDMTTWGITPPTALMGIIRVKNQLRLYFDIKVAPAT